MTGSPSGLNFENNPAPTIAGDSITLKAMAERWGWDAITSRAARTLSQVARFDNFVKTSNGKLLVAASRKQLADYVALRKNYGGNVSAGILGIEGAIISQFGLQNQAHMRWTENWKTFKYFTKLG